MRVELHCHLDGSLNIDFVNDMLREQGIVYEREELKKKLEVRQDCRSLTEYLQKFDLPLLCLQTKDGLRRAAYELVKSAALEDVRYIEVRFAPMLSTERGLNCTEVNASVVEGLQKGGQEFDVFASAIVCAMRNHSPERNMEMLRCARGFIGKGVCALDLAGDESAFPTELFRELFVQAKEWGIPFTIHSGECGSVDNIREAIELGAKRLGHGIALQKSPELRELCREKRIGIEMCPTSNLQTKAVEDLDCYPLKQFLEEGLLVSIHTDNRTVSGTTMEREEQFAKNTLQLSREMLTKCTENAIKTAFASDEIKQKLMEELRGEKVMEKLSKRALGCMYVATGIVSFVMLGILAALNFFLFIPENIVVGKTISIVVGILIFIHTAISPYFRFHRYSYKIDEEFIDIREGYLFVTRNIVPIERLHKMQTVRGPIDTMFGVAKVKVTTAGGDVVIRFLEQEKAERIAEGLGKYINRMVEEQREPDGE